MNKSRTVLLCICLIAVLAAPTLAYPPQYLLLRTPVSQRSHHRPTYGYYPGHARPVQTSTYSYGWFGVRPRSHWSRHFGYYRNYTEWSAR